MAEKKVDVLIIGSGHTGGMAAKILTEKGISCTMLDAGPMLNFERDRTLKPANQLPFRGLDAPGRHPHIFQSSEFSANQWIDEKVIPYNYPAGQQYNWVRVRSVGGRSPFWGRQSFRLSDYEFKCKDHDGFGENWPISYKDLESFYSRVEGIFRVQGHTDGLPQYPDGNFIEDKVPWSNAMQRFVDAGKKMGVPVTKPRSALGTGGLAASINLLIPDAVATGKLTTIPNSIVRKITVDKHTGLADGVIFIDRHSYREMTIKARVVIVAAGTLETTRLLMISEIANSSGVLGHHLCDQIYGAGIAASVPEARGGKGKRGVTGGGALIPRFRNLETKTPGYLRGFAVNVSSSTGPMDARWFTEYGSSLEKKLDEYYGSGFTTNIMGETLGHYENHVSLNKQVVDAWGMPTLTISTKYGDNEINMAKDMVDTTAAMAEAAGFEVLVRNYEFNPPGYSIHEQGTARMGDNPKTSVVNKWNQSHDVKNLFITDASVFVSAGWQNPTITMCALAMRASEYLAEEMRKGNI
ncbi:GMC oxidoreductase [Terriglobus sp. 2YAB30_2]|uniref:GMC oxidoreductase n=1 Tax=Terriglobus sp. 2YAB30_2 TaxID=3233023 RepID=UPI003F9BC518